MSGLYGLKEIDLIVDQVIEDESKARELKRALHDANKWQDKPAVVQEEDEEEDLWDDVPV